MATPPIAVASRFPIHVGRPRDDDWIPAANLLEPGSPLLEERLLAFGKQLGTNRAAVALSLLLEAYTNLLASVAFGSLLSAGRAPELAVTNVSVHLESGGVPDALAVHDAAPRAGDGLDRLDGVAASLLERHLGVLVERLGALRAGRGRRALWGLVAGGCAAAIVDAVERSGGQPRRTRALTEALFALPGSPLPGPPRLLEVAPPRPAAALSRPTGAPPSSARGRSESRLVRKRLSCCLSYALPGCDYCATCPVWSDRRAAELAAEGLAVVPSDG